MRTKPFIPPPPAAIHRIEPPPLHAYAPVDVPEENEVHEGQVGGSDEGVTDSGGTEFSQAPAAPPAEPSQPITDIDAVVYFRSSQGEDVMRLGLLSAFYLAARATRVGRQWVIYDSNGQPALYIDADKVLHGPERLTSLFQTQEKLLFTEAIDAAFQTMRAFRIGIPANARKSDILKALDVNIQHIEGLM